MSARWPAALAIASLASPVPASPSAGQARDARIAAWTEALELDLAAQVLREGPVLVAPGGALARDGEALALVARALYRAGRETEADELLASAAPLPEAGAAGRAAVELARAWIALERDDLGGVRALLAGPDGAPRFPKAPEAWLYLARSFARAGEAARAAPLLERFLELAPHHGEAPAAWYLLARAALEQGDLEAARARRERAEAAGRWQAYYRTRRLQIRRDPDAPLPRLGLAQLWMEAEEPARAAEVLAELARRAPGFAPGWTLLGEARRALDDPHGAREAYTRALELDPEERLARHNRAVLDLAAGREADAERDLAWLVEHAPERDPRAVNALLLLARLADRRGEGERAEGLHADYRARGGTEPLRP